MDPMHRLFVIMAITLTIVAFLYSPVQLAISEATERDAQIQTQRFASAINMMLSSPDLTTYTIDTPRAACTIVITDSFVRMTTKPVTGQKVSFTASIIRNGVSITNGEFKCKAPLELKRDSSGLRIIQGGN